MYEASSIAVCCWHASAPVKRSRFTCSANKYLQFTAPVTSTNGTFHLQRKQVSTIHSTSNLYERYTFHLQRKQVSTIHSTSNLYERYTFHLQRKQVSTIHSTSNLCERNTLILCIG